MIVLVTIFNQEIMFSNGVCITTTNANNVISTNAKKISVTELTPESTTTTAISYNLLDSIT